MSDHLADLADRWTRARRAAVVRVLARDPEPTETDEDLLAQALARDAEATHRAAFDNSHKLARGFARFYGEPLAFEDLPRALVALQAPCAARVWTALGEGAVRGRRSGCPYGRLGSAACDFWCEAIDGLVLGGACGVRHARHASVGHGDDRCVDVFYTERHGSARFGPIPPDMQEALDQVRRLVHAFDSARDVEFLGLAERVLYYREKHASAAAGLRVTTLVERAVRRRFPDISLREVSPRAVFSGDAA